MNTISKHEEQCIYNDLGYFMLRIPVLSMQHYRDMFLFKNVSDEQLLVESTNKVINLSKESKIKEIIAISSLSLSESLDKLQNSDNERKKNQVLHSLLKYLIRMSTRPTPFGLMAGVTGGIVSGLTNMKLLPEDNFRKRARADMKWLLAIVKELESNIDVVKQLKVIKNSSINFLGDRLELPYSTQYGQRKEENYKMDCISIKYTEAVQFTLECCKEYITYDQLLKLLQKNYKDAPPKVIEDFLWNIFTNEFIISELRPPLTDVFTLDYILNKLKNLNIEENYVEELGIIKNLLHKYNNTQLGEGELILKELLSKMKELQDSKTPIQADLYLDKKDITLNKKVAFEFSKAAECLWKLSNNNKSSYSLEQYRMDFIEKYGTNREIPVLELLDDDSGLGSPFDYKFPQSKRQAVNLPRNIYDKKRDDYIFNEFIKAMNNDNKEIEITENFLKTLEIENIKPCDAPISLDIYGSIMASSPEEIDKENYSIIIAPNAFSGGAGRTFGRFIDILDDNIQNNLSNINHKEKSILEDFEFVEIVYLPASARLANVSICKNYRDYELVLGTNSSKDKAHTLPLSDILIGATLDKFYIKSKSLNKKLIITTSHMLNTMKSPNVYRFLREISADGTKAINSFNWGSLSSSPYLPRVRYRKTILSPAKWKLNFEILNIKKGVKENEFVKAILLWKTKMQVPNLVYLTESDNRLLLDLDNPLHLRELLNTLNASKQIILVESFLQYNENFIKSQFGDYCSEVVFPLIRNCKEKSTIKTETNICDSKKINNDLRIKLPGSEWLFIKLYGNSKRENEFIAYHLREFCNEIIKENLAEQFFFMRYSDDKPHIRLRFKGNSKILMENLMPAINNWCNELLNKNLLSKLVIDTYEREIERYGGTEFIDLAEKIFYEDSKVASELLYIHKTNKTKFSLENITAISIIHILEAFGWSFSKQLTWFNSMVDYKKFKDEFNKDRTLYMKICNANNDWNELCKYEDGMSIHNILIKRNTAIANMAYALKNNNQISNTEEGIVGSIIHLHCNRMIGTDRIKENEIMTIVRHSLYNLRYMKEDKIAK